MMGECRIAIVVIRVCSYCEQDVVKGLFELRANRGYVITQFCASLTPQQHRGLSFTRLKGMASLGFIMLLDGVGSLRVSRFSDVTFEFRIWPALGLR